VPLCRTHHRALHRSGDEAAWWQSTGLDPVTIAQRLWQRTRLNGVPSNSTSTPCSTHLRCTAWTTAEQLHRRGPAIDDGQRKGKRGRNWSLAELPNPASSVHRWTLRATAQDPPQPVAAWPTLPCRPGPSCAPMRQTSGPLLIDGGQVTENKSECSSKKQPRHPCQEAVMMAEFMQRAEKRRHRWKKGRPLDRPRLFRNLHKCAEDPADR
jgi:hypothetical protein